MQLSFTKYLSATLFILLVNANIQAQNISSTSVNNLEKKYQADISIHPATGAIRFLRFPSDRPLSLDGNTLQEKVNTFFELFPDVLGSTRAKEELFYEKSTRDEYGKHHLFFEQRKNNIPVFGGDIRFHFDENKDLTAINGVFIPEIQENTTALVNMEQASETAMELVEEQTYTYATAPIFIHEKELILFNKGLVYNEAAKTELVYRFEIRNDVEVREYLFIDAHTGKLVEQYTGMPHVLNRIVYETNTGNPIWTEGDAFPGSLDQWQQNEVVTGGHTYNFFLNAFGFASYDGADATMRTVNNSSSLSCPNASWNGSTTNYCTGTASDDVIGHEWGHAYVEYTCDLIYAWQSGALNESYADIWGETIDILNNYEDAGEDLSLRTGCNSSVRWRMGEDASAFGGAIRDMFDPTCNGDPGKVSDSQYHCNTSDNGGVHINSGVNNHAYMLLVDGGFYNGQSVSPIGFTKAAHIFWRAQSVYLTNTSDFATQAAALNSACQDLVGVNLNALSTGAPAGLSGEIITTADCQAVANAVAAVEMAMTPSCNFNPLLTPNAPNLCNNPDVENNILFEDFENGIGAFSEVQLPDNPSTWDNRTWMATSALPQGRSGQAMFGPNPVNGNCANDLENGIIRLQSPVITNPAGRTTPVFLSFDHYVATEPNWDGGNLKYSINGGSWTIMPASAFVFNGHNGSINGGGNDNPMAAESAFTGTDEGSVGGSWGTTQVNLTSLGLVAGDNIQFRWELGSDGCNGREGWYVDEVQVCTCESTSGALPVELTRFVAEPKSEQINLAWTTESEFNNSGFLLERSLFPDQDFVEISWASGLGNSDSPENYLYEDKAVLKDLRYYYRLRQIDLDGSENLSKVISAKIKGGEEFNFILYPNPARDAVNLQIGSSISTDYKVSLLTTDGKELITQVNSTVLDISNLSSGLYWVKVNTDKKTSIRKLLIE